MKQDTVWANEAGMGVKIEQLENNWVRISIVEYETGAVHAAATLTNWRWERLKKVLE